MLRIGLTGGIGSGKSAVAARLADLGAIVVDADVIAREVVAPGTDGLAALVEAFGPEILGGDEALDRPRLGDRVFGDDEARATLNGIVHPLVGAETWRQVQQAEADGVDVCVQDIPLLVEGGMAAAFPLVVVVAAPVDVRVARLAARSGLDEEQARARMAAQASDEQRRAAADVWIANDATLEALHAEVDELWRSRLLPFADNLAAGRRAARSDRATIVDFDSSWPEQARRVIERVRQAAGERASSVDHIGSTAVPGLATKDVIDLQVVVADLTTAREVAGGLSQAGLVRPAGEWEDDLGDGTTAPKAFAANADPGRPVNCHVRTQGSVHARQSVLLRDWLRAHSQEADEYARVKRDLSAGDYATVDEYAVRKDIFVRPALQRAEQWAAATGWAP